jgi:chromosomal replication initiation ATPase DnaA
MTPAEIDTELKSRGCVLVHDSGDFALVYPYGINSKRAQDLAAKTRAAALVEAWHFLNPEQEAQDRIEVITRLVARDYGVTVEGMCASGRPEPLATARRVAMALSRLLTSATLQYVAERFGREGNATIYALTSIDDQCASDPRFAARFETLRAACIAAINPKSAP